jgi:RNA polymerase sigma-70 factor (ECF subfamily)
VDSAPTQSAGLEPTITSVAGTADAGFSGIPSGLCRELAREAECEQVGLSDLDFAAILQRIGTRHNYGLPVGSVVGSTHMAAFFRSLKLRELALAQACALGHGVAWKRFITEYRSPLTQAAIAITGSSSQGREMAESLYSELFGLKQKEGVRWSPFASYSGRGSLMGWLRTTLAQRHVDHHRRTYRETPLEHEDYVAAAVPAQPEQGTLALLGSALNETLQDISAEERFLLSAYFLDGRKLLEIGRLLQVHEATVSRKLKRLTEDLRKRLLKRLQRSGMARRAAEEALGTDPRDLSLNLRNLLQYSSGTAFLEKDEKKRTDTP